MLIAILRSARRPIQILLLAILSLFAATSASRAALKISAKPTSNVTCSGGACTATAKKAVLNVADLQNMLASGSVAVVSGAQAQDIEIDDALSWASAQRLTLDSFHSIAFNKPVSVLAKGALTITTNDGGFGGDFQFFGTGHVKFSDLSGGLTINGHFYTLFDKIRALALDIRHNPSGYFALAKSIDLKKHHYGQALITHEFSGFFEGLGNTISNMTIADTTGQQIGLFSVLVGPPATIRDIGLTSVSVEAEKSGVVGSLVGYSNWGTIQNSYATGSVSG